MDTGEGCVPLILPWIHPSISATNMAMLVLVCIEFGVFIEINSVAGRLRAAVEDRTFSPLPQCCLTVDLLSSYSGPLFRPL